MKKIILFLVMLFCLTGCVAAEYSSDGKMVATEEARQGVACNICAKEFTYKGHDYIMFYELMGYAGGVVHDPNCPCHKTE